MIVKFSNLLQKSKVDVKLSVLLFLFLYAKLTRSHFISTEMNLFPEVTLWSVVQQTVLGASLYKQ